MICPVLIMLAAVLCGTTCVLGRSVRPFVAGELVPSPAAMDDSMKVPDNLMKKWIKFFDYMNIDKTGSLQSLNQADHDMLKMRLENSPFSSIATKVADMFYRPQIGHGQNDKEKTQTEAEFISGMTMLYQNNLLSDPDHANAIYDHLVSTQPNGAGPLKKETLKNFEKAIGQMQPADADNSLSQITSAETITKQELVDAIVGYVSDPTAMIPLFGPYKSG